MKRLNVEEVKYLAYRLAKETMEWDEPIPDFYSRFPGILESCLQTPFQTFGGKPLYRGIIKKAAILFYLMIKNHPFQNGNKRIAVTTLMVFLYENGNWLKVDNQELYNFALWIASSPPKLKEQAVEGIEVFISQNLLSAKK